MRLANADVRFVIRMAARETRASWQRLLFFFLCVAIGVGAIVTLRSVIQSVRAGLAGEARSLLAADLVLQSDRAWDPATRTAIEQRLLSSRVLDRTETIETMTMVRPADADKAAARMIELRGVKRGFPFYGGVTLQDGRPYSHQLLAHHGALVRPELLTQLDVQVGDQIMVATKVFTIRGVMLTEPGSRVGVFSFGSRVLVDYDDLVETGLVRYGSRARHRLLLRVMEADVNRLVRDLRRDLRERSVGVWSYRSTEDQISEDFQRAEDYLSLVGFVILILGGVGVWSVTRVFVRQKVKSIAVLKCLGATGRQVLAIYLVQVLALGLIGSLVGIALAWTALRSLPAFVTTAIGQLSYGLTVSAASQGLAVGLLVSLLFTLVPLLEIRRAKPLLLLRPDSLSAIAAESGGAFLKDLRHPLSAIGRRVRGNRARAVALPIVVAGLALVATWQAGSVKAGLAVCVGFAAVTVVLHAAGAGLVRLVSPLASATWFPLRHAVRGLGRPGNQTSVILVSVGLGAFFIMAVQAVQANLLRQFALQSRPGNPDLFLIDVQSDQAEAVQQFLRQANPGRDARILPVVRARIAGVRGRRTNLDGFESVRGRGLGREFVLTYRDRLEANERLTRGRLWEPDAGGGPQVSVERRLFEEQHLDLGDVIRFDVLGRVIAATITSVRDVEWGDSRSGGFMFVLNAAALAGAPATCIVALEASSDATDRARLQRDLVARFPNVSAIDVREVLATVQRVFDSVTLAITVVGAVAALSGALILIGAIAMTKFQRVYEAAIFKTLGATSRTMAAMLLLEYGSLGLLAGIIGSAAAVALSWGLTRFLFEIPWTPTPAINVAGIALTALGVSIVGMLASLDVLRRKPLATLRAE